MSDILLNCVYFTHLMTIFCTLQVFLASCIRLFDRLSDIGVFNHRKTVQATNDIARTVWLTVGVSFQRSFTHVAYFLACRYRAAAIWVRISDKER